MSTILGDLLFTSDSIMTHIHLIFFLGQKYHTINGHNCEVRKALPKNELDKFKMKQGQSSEIKCKRSDNSRVSRMESNYRSKSV